ncbi:MAG TPA: hypothetical protein PK176_03660 [Acidobacteriota bacterium]|nr:hypothetical protein [Acidobacteriota bacterium]HQM62387.1 hypothetical protein [Acidobacteriota bacterium]
MTTKRLVVIASVILLTVIVNGGRPFSFPHNGSVLPRHHFDAVAISSNLGSAAEQSLRAALLFQSVPNFQHLAAPPLQDRRHPIGSTAAHLRTDRPIVTIPSTTSAAGHTTPALAANQRLGPAPTRIGNVSGSFGSGDPSEITEPVVPIAVLATLVNEDPWNGAFEPSDDNPFTQVLLQTDPEPNNPAHDSNGGVEDDSDASAQAGGESSGDDGADAASETSDTDIASTVESSEGDPEFMVFHRSATGQTVCLLTKRIDEHHFKLDNGTVLEIRLCGTFLDRRGDPSFLLFDDFNNDFLTDALNIQQSNGSCRLFLNTGAELAPMRSFTPDNRPKFGTRLPFYEPSSRQLMLYCPDDNVLDIYEDWGIGRFELYVSIPLAFKYDGIAASDFNGDGFGDLVLQNLKYNRVNYLQNIKGQALQLLATPPSFSPPALVQFSPRPGRATAKFWLCDYKDQLMIYPVISGPAQLAALLNRLEADNCLVVGDFNQDNRIDFAIGRISF